jgi:hypothetical protein
LPGDNAVHAISYESGFVGKRASDVRTISVRMDNFNRFHLHHGWLIIGQCVDRP